MCFLFIRYTCPHSRPILFRIAAISSSGECNFTFYFFKTHWSSNRVHNANEDRFIVLIAKSNVITFGMGHLSFKYRCIYYSISETNGQMKRNTIDPQIIFSLFSPLLPGKKQRVWWRENSMGWRDGAVMGRFRDQTLERSLIHVL